MYVQEKGNIGNRYNGHNQIRYLIDEKNVSDEALGSHLADMLSDLGIRVDYVPTPKPWEMTRKK